MELLFHRAYEMAEYVSQVVTVSNSFDELGWETPQVSSSLQSFSKVSLLGYFCYTHISMEDYRRARKDPSSNHLSDLESALSQYGIQHKPYRDFLKENGLEDAVVKDPNQYDFWADPEYLRDWMDAQEGAFDELWDRMADEVFHLLFGNRGFLVEFNTELATFRRERGDAPSRRCRIPQWVKRAVYFRENGKCALCKKDLSGLVAIDPKQHYDHIVPLKELGANDPCNIQLLCANCNLTKAAGKALTSNLYDAWWT